MNHPTAANDPSVPLQSFRFCPQCGEPNPQIRQTRSIHCHGCGFRYFVNCAATVGGFVFYRDELILTVRAEEPHKGMLGLPGGFIEFDEAADDALRREIFEELSIAVTDLTYLASAPNEYWYAGVLYKVCSTFYTCRSDDISQIRAQDDVAGFRLIHPRQVDPGELAFSSARGALAQLLAQSSQTGSHPCST